jgi:hypothetical protein
MTAPDVACGPDHASDDGMAAGPFIDEVAENVATQDCSFAWVVSGGCRWHLKADIAAERSRNDDLAP